MDNSRGVNAFNCHRSKATWLERETNFSSSCIMKHSLSPILHQLVLLVPLPFCCAASVAPMSLCWCLSLVSYLGSVLSSSPCSFFLCLFVDEGAEDQVGALRRFPSHEPSTSGERRRLLAPSISVSVPDDDPYNSDEEYYEHPLFSSEWTTSNVLPSVTAQCAEVHLGQEKGEPSMVPFCSSSPACGFDHTCYVKCAFIWCGRGWEPVFSIWKWSPYRGCMYPNASTIEKKKKQLSSTSFSLFLRCIQEKRES